MNKRSTQIGFSQRVRLEWLEKTANLKLAGNDRVDVSGVLQEYLKDKVSIDGEAERGNREKVITILSRIWLGGDPDLDPLRTEGLELLKRIPGPEHIILHWGMTMASYPFWAAVATQVGRLLRLQGSAAISQVQRRLREQYGERETVSRATRRVIRSYLDWGVLKETDKKGIYSWGILLKIEEARIIAWLAEASLRASDKRSIPLKDLIESPAFFPFLIRPISGENLVSESSRLDILRHGLNEDLVMLGRS